MRAVAFFAAAALSAAAAPALAVQDTAPSRWDGRVRAVAHNPQNVTRVYVARLNSTAIDFGADEEIIDVGLGDSNAYLNTEVKGASNILLLKPTEARSTVMHVFTKNRESGEVKTHQFDVIVVSPSLQVADGGGTVPAFRAADLTVRVVYPAEERRKRRAEAEGRRAESETRYAEWAQEQSHVQGDLNHAYTACGDAGLDPLDVWDNGRATTFRWPAGKPVPVLYPTGVDGQAGIPVQQRATGDLVVVYQVSHRWVLRLGDAVDCVRMAPSAWRAYQAKLAVGLPPPAVERVVAPPPPSYPMGRGRSYRRVAP